MAPAPPDHGRGRAAARSKNLTQHFSGMPGVSAGAGLCRVREAQVFLSPLRLHICPLWPPSEELAQGAQQTH